MYKKLYIVGVLALTFCLTSNATTPMHGGILRIELNKFKNKFALTLYNKGGSVFATVYRDEEEGEYKVYGADKKINNMLLKEIRAYYLDYGLMIFDADTVQSGQFPVYVGSETKYIKVSEIKTPLISYQNWQNFFKTVFIKTNSTSFICEDTLSQKKVPNAEKYSYRIKKISGDWAYVECLKTCEQCPSGTIIKGWVRWKDKNNLHVDIFYFC